MATRIYKTPFAATGDKEALATADQPDGKVSLQAGWTPDYELPNSDPNYRPVGRAEMNGVLGEITEGLGDMQLNGFATWQAVVGGWPIGALVSHGGLKYQSTTGSNTSTPGVGGSNWERVVTTVGTLPVASSSAAGIVELATNAETQAGTDAGRAVTPAGLQSRVQDSTTDGTTNRLLTVGAFGLGGTIPPYTGYGWPADFNQMDTRTGWATIGGSAVNGPSGAGSFGYNGFVLVENRGTSGNLGVRQKFVRWVPSGSQPAEYVRYGTGAPGSRTWTAWEEVITSRTIPAASDTVAGIVELATTAETTTGTDATRAVTPGALAAQFPIRGHQIYNTAGSYTWSVPSGVTRVRVIVSGGGGGGGGAVGNPGKGAVGGGGGGGATSVKLVNLAGAGTVSVTVGAGGAGGIANNAGVAGAASSFGAFTSASGGLGGQQGVDESGAGGGGAATSPGSDFSVVGGAGVSGRIRDGVYAMAGVGGASLLGDCFSSVNVTGASNAGLNGGVGANGAGGGGGAAYGATATGGKGGDGIVVIEW
ncbi:glycine-rich domain-containing protein [Achromobacter animicus]